MLILHFFKYLEIHIYVGKLSEEHFNVWWFSNSGDKVLFLPYNTGWETETLTELYPLLCLY